MVLWPQCLYLSRREDRHGHWMCWMSTGGKNGLMWRTHASSTPSVRADSWDTNSGVTKLRHRQLYVVPRAYRRITVVPPIGSLSCTLPGGDATGSTTNKQNKQNKSNIIEKNIIKTERTDKTKQQTGSPPPRQSYFLYEQDRTVENIVLPLLIVVQYYIIVLY